MVIRACLRMVILIWFCCGFTTLFANENADPIPKHPGTFYFLAEDGTELEGFYFKDDDVGLLRDFWRQLYFRYWELAEASTKTGNESPESKFDAFYVQRLLDAVGPHTHVSDYDNVLAKYFDNYHVGKGFLRKSGSNLSYLSLEELMLSKAFSQYSDWYAEHFQLLGVWPGTIVAKEISRYDRAMCQLAKNDPEASIVSFTTAGSGRHIANQPDIKLRFWDSRKEWSSSRFKFYNPNIMTNWFCFRVQGVTSDAPLFKIGGDEGPWLAFKVQEVGDDITTGFYCNAKGCTFKRKKVDRSWRYRYKSRWKKQ